MDRHAGQFCFVFKRINGATSNYNAVQFGNLKGFNLLLSPVTRSAHQDTGLFKGADDFDDIRNIHISNLHSINDFLWIISYCRLK
jgi:hypothetical protein